MEETIGKNVNNNIIALINAQKMIASGHICTRCCSHLALHIQVLNDYAETGVTAQ